MLYEFLTINSYPIYFLLALVNVIYIDNLTFFFKFLFIEDATAREKSYRAGGNHFVWRCYCELCLQENGIYRDYVVDIDMIRGQSQRFGDVSQMTTE